MIFLNSAIFSTNMKYNTNIYYQKINMLWKFLAKKCCILNVLQIKSKNEMKTYLAKEAYYIFQKN